MLPLLQSSFTDEKTLPLLGVGVLALVYIVLRPMFKRKDPLDRSPPFQSLSQQRGVERQMQSLLVDLSEMARQISGQLDTRASKLDALIREADAKIAQLRKGIGSQPSNSTDAASPTGRFVESRALDTAASQTQRASKTRPPSHPGQSLFPVPDSELFPPPALHADVPRPRPDEEPPSDDSARHAEVYALADAGHSARAIATTLDRPSGEIELILALRSPKHIS